MLKQFCNDKSDLTVFYRYEVADDHVNLEKFYDQLQPLNNPID